MLVALNGPRADPWYWGLVLYRVGRSGGGGGADVVEGKGYVLGSTSGIVFVCRGLGLEGTIGYGWVDWVGWLSHYPDRWRLCRFLRACVLACRLYWRRSITFLHISDSVSRPGSPTHSAPSSSSFFKSPLMKIFPPPEREKKNFAVSPLFSRLA